MGWTDTVCAAVGREQMDCYCYYIDCRHRWQKWTCVSSSALT